MEDKPPLEKDEYEIQFYGKAVREFFTEFNGFFNDITEDIFHQMLKQVEKQLSEKRVAIFKVQQKKAPEVLQQFQVRCAEHKKKLQFLMENKTFHIPEDVVLPEDRCQVLYDQEQAGKVEQDFQLLLSRLEAVRYIKEALKLELESCDSLLEGTTKVVNQAETKFADIESSRVSSTTIALMGQIKTAL